MRKMVFAVAVAFLIVGGGAPAEAKDDPKELESSCDAGDLEACVILGRMFENDARHDNVPIDLARAVSLFQKACDGEFSKGCYELGTCYRLGQGVQQDAALASSILEQACSLGNNSGCRWVAEIHDPQDGTLKDATRWAVFMEKCCDRGCWSGQLCRRLGLAYDIGMWGVPKDTDHATELFKKGCVTGDEESCPLITR